MRVYVHATLRPAVGGRQAEIEHAPGMTVSGFLTALTAKYPALEPELFDEDGRLYRHVHVMVNGRDAPYLERGLGTELGPSDTLDIFPPVAGGG
ncbi:MAG: ubiquitin-like small modifier protein 1 [Chloroflexota bacterium]